MAYAYQEALPLVPAEIALAGHGSALERIRAKAAALTAPPTDPAVAAAAALAASKEKISRTLAGAPWPSPADRSRPGLQADAYDRVKADLARKTEAAADGPSC